MGDSGDAHSVDAELEWWLEAALMVVNRLSVRTHMEWYFVATGYSNHLLSWFAEDPVHGGLNWEVLDQLQ